MVELSFDNKFYGSFYNDKNATVAENKIIFSLIKLREICLCLLLVNVPLKEKQELK
jgi:hypothetical protein